MPHFRYRAARPDGTVVKDRIEGSSEQAIRSQLEDGGLLILSLEGSRSVVTGPGLLARRGGLPLREFLVFNQELSALVKAGLPILKTFDLLADRAVQPGFRAALQDVRAEIRGGASISEAMARHPGYFPELYRASLRSGEQTGNLPEVLARYIAYVKLLIGVREKVVKALAYPVFLIAIGMAVVAFLLVYVMPTFADIYGQNKTELPGPTRMLLVLVEDWWAWLPWALVIVGGVAAASHLWMRTDSGHEQFDRIKLRLPILGEVLLKSQVIRLTRTLSTVLAGGVPLLSALQITVGAITNRVLAQALVRVADRVRGGMGLGASLRQEAMLPPLTLEMVEVGETTGTLETMLQEIAEFHEGELDLRLAQLTTWIEPVLLLIMGFLVGGIVIIMYLPVFQIAGTV